MEGLKICKKSRIESALKKLFATVLMVIFYIQIWAFNDQGFGEGTQLYVMANSGLTLREEPNKNSEILGIADFGSTVHVLTQPDSSFHWEKINWVEGRWLYVDYDGVTGYMFDGFLSDLPLPIYEFERCQLDLDLIYPLESWSEVNLGESDQNSIEAGSLIRITDEYIGGEKLVRSQKNESYKLELYLTDVRLMDAYHLLQSMIESNERLETFRNQTTFINNKEGELLKVKINLDNPVVLKRIGSGTVKITIRSDNYKCSL